MPLISYGVAVAGRAIALLAAPALIASTVDGVISGSAKGFTALLLVLIGGAVCEVAVSLLGAVAIGARTAAQRVRTVRHLLALGPRGSLSAGDGVSRVVHASAEAAEAPLMIVQVVAGAATSVGGLVLLWVTDWRSGIAFVLAIPLILFLAKRFLGDVTSTQGEYFQAQSQIADRLLNALTGIRTIRASGTADRETTRVLRPLPMLSACGRALWSVQRGAVWRMGLLVALSEVLVLAVAGWGVAGGVVSAGDLLAVVGYLSLASAGFDQIDSVLELGYAKAGAARLAEVLAEEPPRAGSVFSVTGPGEVRFEGVTVVRDERRVLDEVDLVVPAGVAMAVVGRSGSGKSTLGETVGRLSDPSSGQVTVDGVAVGELPWPVLRRAVTYAFAAPVLLGDTIGAAIGYGTRKPNVVAAAEDARADAFIRRLPQGYETPLSDAPMSGGELQRVGLARALARRSRVYVLDDAMSGLDTMTEAEVGEAITARLAGRTRLIIAHRAETARRCDLVAWMDSGRVRAVAPHEQLWSDPDYRAVFGR
ncbi:ABC transporter ATP-binding protein [Allokutzneria sp. NRRL B-24872]|uniref:ABC transporter ATP-binding protein n=1 Tax=Allokutzneria sp. NRRL B-24872 TaxID=1137961 RepID=UPI00143CEB4E|nr:ABC transporter ATP-binding protein [Allokutzneria sp. NRRL B-24872]